MVVPAPSDTFLISSFSSSPFPLLLLLHVTTLTRENTVNYVRNTHLVNPVNIHIIKQLT